MPTDAYPKLRQRFVLLAIALVTVVALVIAAIPARAGTANIVVDFNTTTGKVANGAFSGSVSTYGGTATVLNSAKQRQMLSSLGLSYYRIPLQWNDGTITSSAGGFPGGNGDDWINNIKATGAQPMIIVGSSTAGSFNSFTPAEAANLVNHFNLGGNRVDYWVIGNEPNGANIPISEYCTLFNDTATAMKAVDPTIKVIGPAWSYFQPSTLQAFLQCAGNTVDVIDYHHYAMGTTYIENATALADTVKWENEVTQIKGYIAQIVPARANQIEVQVGEYNWSYRVANGYPGWNGEDRFYQSVATVWSASVAGHIAKAGGRSHQYADLNGGLGMTIEKQATADHFAQQVNDPMPMYHGLRMFGGGDLFRKFGSRMVSATTTLADVEVYASADEKNIVVINKNSTTTATASMELKGFGQGTADVWQTNKDLPFSPPVKTDVLTVNGTIDYALPPYSVTTFVLNETRGLKATYYSKQDFSGTIVNRVDPNVDFNWGNGSPAAGIPTDKFSARWTGLITIPETAAYTFYLTGDDGVRLWIDDTLVIDGWGDHPATEYKGKISLTANRAYAVRIEYYDNITAAVARLAWSRPNLAKQIVPTNVLTVAAPPGLTAAYYKLNTNYTFGAMVMSGSSPNIDYGWGSGSPNAAVPVDKFGATWSGKIRVPTTGTYTLTTESDDGVRLYVDDRLIVDDWANHGPTRKSGSISLTAGQPYTIKVQYYDNTYSSTIRLFWNLPGQSLVAIPSNAFTQN